MHGGGWQASARSAFHVGDPGSPSALHVLSRSATAGEEGPEDVSAGGPTCWPRCSSCAAAPASSRSTPSIGLFGASAGAHLASLAALGGSAAIFKGAYPQDAHAFDTKVEALVGVYGVYDVAEMWQRYQLQSPRENNIENFMGAAPMDDPRLYFDASPINYATFANNQIGVLLAVGTEDDLVDRRAQTDVFLMKLKQANFFVRPASCRARRTTGSTTRSRNRRAIPAFSRRGSFVF